MKNKMYWTYIYCKQYLLLEYYYTDYLFNNSISDGKEISTKWIKEL